MIPLVSLVYTVLDKGLARFDAEFFTNSMFRVVGEGGGAYHAIVGTLIITALATLISVPIGLMTAIYLVEYGTGRLKRAITFFVDVMTGIPSIVAGLFAFALFTAALRQRRPHGHHGRGRPLGADDPGRRPLLRGGPQARPQRAARGQLRPRRARSGGRSSRSSCRPPSPASAPASPWPIARVVGETAPLLVTVGLITGDELQPVRRAHGDAARVRATTSSPSRGPPRRRSSTGPGRQRSSSSSWSWRSTSSPA